MVNAVVFETTERTLVGVRIPRPASLMIAIDTRKSSLGVASATSYHSDKLLGTQSVSVQIHNSATPPGGEQGVNAMAYVGQLVSVGEVVPAAGVYEHTACGKRHTFSDTNDTVPPCSNSDCPNRGADWRIVQLTGTSG